VRLACAAGIVSFLVGNAVYAERPAPESRAAGVGSALPGGGAIGAHSVILTPGAGGDSTAVPITADGSFRASGLAPGRYTLRVASITVPRQTQGASIGENVSQGLHATGGALATGAQAVAPASPGAAVPGADGSARLHPERIVHRDLAARMSTNFAVGNQAPRAIEVDGEGAAVDVPSTGTIAGITGGAIAARQ
jgi:hypothetical protein